MPRWSFTYRSALVVLTALVLAGCPPIAPDTTPVANFSATPRTGNTGQLVSFSDLSTTAGGEAIVSWQWNFGDGGRSSEPNPSHTYLVSGDFTVSLTVTSGSGSHTRTRNGYIRIESPSGSAQLDGDGGTVSSNGVSIQVPAGALQSRVNFGITRVNTEIPINIFETINRVGDTFRVTHDSATALSASSDDVPFQTARLSIPYAEDVVPTGSRTPGKVHIVAQLSTGEVIPIIGTITSGSVDAQVSDLPNDALYTVVYRPDAYLATAAVSTTKTPTSTEWAQSWQLSLSPALLTQLTALRLGSVNQASSFFRTSFTEEQLSDTEQALMAGLLNLQAQYEAVQSRSPRLVTTNGSYGAITFNFVSQYSSAIGSLDAVYYAGSPFGSIVIDPQQLLAISTWNADRFDADRSLTDIAFKISAEQAVGEVLTRAVVDGYDYPEVTATSVTDGAEISFMEGIREGMALYVGQMNGGRTANRSQLDGDWALLSTPLFAPFDLEVAGYAAASQDFFRYVANRYSPDPALAYLASGTGGVKGLLEEVRLAVSTGLVAPGFEEAALLSSVAIDEALFSHLEVSLGEAYYQFALDLAFRHGASGVLRPSDAGRLPLVLDSSRFGTGAILTGTLDGPDSGLDFPALGEFGLTEISPLSSRVVIVEADPSADNLELTFNRADWSADARNQTVQVVVYREGLPGVPLAADATTMSFSGFEADAGQSVSVFYVVIVNTSSTTASSVTLSIQSSTTE